MDNEKNVNLDDVTQDSIPTAPELLARLECADDGLLIYAVLAGLKKLEEKA